MKVKGESIPMAVKSKAKIGCFSCEYRTKRSVE